METKYLGECTPDRIGKVQELVYDSIVKNGCIVTTQLRKAVVVQVPRPSEYCALPGCVGFGHRWATAADTKEPLYTDITY